MCEEANLKSEAGGVKVWKFAVSLAAMMSVTSLNPQDIVAENTTTICAIAKRPASFDGHLVTVKARVFSDGMHGSLIYDESCGDYGLALFLAVDAKGEKDLEAALSWCHLTTRGKFITATFTGTISVDPEAPYQRRITVQRVDDLIVKSTHSTSASFPTPCPDPPNPEKH